MSPAPGTFGCVVLAKDVNTGELVAIKKMVRGPAHGWVYAVLWVQTVQRWRRAFKPARCVLMYRSARRHTAARACSVCGASSFAHGPPYSRQPFSCHDSFGLDLLLWIATSMHSTVCSCEGLAADELAAAAARTHLPRRSANTSMGATWSRSSSTTACSTTRT